MLDLKKHLLTRILSCALVFTILFSDISAYAASDMQQSEAGFEEQIQEEALSEETEKIEEFSAEEDVEEEEKIVEIEESQVKETPEEETVLEEEPVPEQKTAEQTNSAVSFLCLTSKIHDKAQAVLL